jgi:hypothetical protein
MSKIIKIPDDAFVILATGDRNWDDEVTVRKVLNFYAQTERVIIVHGYAKGLDTIVHNVALELNMGVIPCPAHWRHNEPKCVKIWGPCPIDCMEIVGRPAGAIRNRWMYQTYPPNVVIGFHNDIMTSKGTKDMLKVSMKGGTETWLYTSNGEEIENPPLTNARKSKKIKESSSSTEELFSWE